MKTFTFEIDEKNNNWERNEYSIKAKTIYEAERRILQMIESKIQPLDVEYINNIRSYEEIETIEYEKPGAGFNIKENNDKA